MDNDLEDEFRKNGFVKIKFLDGETTNGLREFYMNNFLNNQNHIAKPDHNRDYTEFSVIDFVKESRKICFDFINKKFSDSLNLVLLNYKPVIGNFISKYPGKGILPLHQNWSLVDEELYSSVSVWVPLQDSNAANGTLKVLPGSHLFFRGFRIAESHERFLKISDEFRTRFFKDIEVDFGEAIILDDALIHGSNENLTGQIRIAVQQILIPAELSHPFFCFRESEGANEIASVYKVDRDFFFDLTDLKGDVSLYSLIKQFNFQNSFISDDELLHLIASNA